MPSWSAKVCVIKERCAPSSKRMLASWWVWLWPTVATAVFKSEIWPLLTGTFVWLISAKEACTRKGGSTVEVWGLWVGAKVSVVVQGLLTESVEPKHRLVRCFPLHLWQRNFDWHAEDLCFPKQLKQCPRVLTLAHLSRASVTTWQL